MDFKEILQKEIEERKREISSISIESKQTKYIKQSDLKRSKSDREQEELDRDISIELEFDEENQEEPVSEALRKRKNHFKDFKEENPSSLDNNAATVINHTEKSSRQNDDFEVSSLELVDLKLFNTDPEKAISLAYQLLKGLLKAWQLHLEAQSEEDLKSSQGRMNLSLQKQSKENLKIFFRLFKKKELQKDVLENVIKICHHIQKREYVNANDVYLQLAIGNAPWPIGVTMVGIHERSARERISSPQTARIVTLSNLVSYLIFIDALNDESSRKWLQAIKRLITFSQTKYPPMTRSQLMG